jgi:hypothetical protein
LPDSGGGQDISFRDPDRKERAEVIISIAGQSGAPPVAEGSIEELVVGMLRLNPDFPLAADEERRRMASELTDVLDVLGYDEACIAARLYQLAMKAGDGRALPAGPMAEAVEDITAAWRKEREAVLSGKAMRAGTQIPLLIAEHARLMVRQAAYDLERAKLEAGVWDADDDIADMGRSALAAAYGLGGPRPGGIGLLAWLSPRMAGAEGMGPALAGLCMAMQSMRERGIPRELSDDGLSAFAWLHDPEMTPTPRGLVIISEIGCMGGEVTDPLRTVMDAIARMERK